MTQFSDLGLNKHLLNTLKGLGYETPTPIQAQAIPTVLDGHDVLGLAQTGTGKTAAFGLPMVDHLMHKQERPAPKNIRALVLAPTRELVNQIATNLRAYVKGTPLKIGSVVGGASINVQVKNLTRGTDILVATPGRLLDLVERRAVFLDHATFLVLDEADQMLDLGFIVPLRKIAKLVGDKRQTMLFSATMPKQIEDLSSTYLKDPKRVEVTPPGKAADKVTQSVFYVAARDKLPLLRDLLSAAERANPAARAMVFSRTKHGAEKLMKQLVEAGFKAESVHGNKSQGQRERAIKNFRNGECRVLVATDVAARGIDIPGVTHVYNYDLPEVAEAYVHRIGRTARAGADGAAVAFCSSTDMHLLRAIEKLMSIKIEVAGGEEPVAERPAGRKPRGGAGHRGRRPNGHEGSGERREGGFRGERRGGGEGRGGERRAEGSFRNDGLGETREDRPRASVRPAGGKGKPGGFGAKRNGGGFGAAPNKASAKPRRPKKKFAAA
ncbi:DEAD/DEAH box helicase [Limoniibacter endophyticus]|uniref:DEAD/DEAH box helicase n=1 Tax=Limoniibacter endophyticus TaxID=1565040 RepID=UPI001672A231|nr:DEAD/DEAH box helicase [Limoniibacter endophyticus]